MAEQLFKHRQVYEHLRKSIVEGRFSAGEQIPTEVELQAKFKASRITVARAVRDLARDGLLVRRRGAGSFVKGTDKPARQLLSILVPNLGGIFVPMCGTITRELESVGGQLTISNLDRGTGPTVLRQAKEISRQCRDNGTRGLFFVPFELPPGEMHVNLEIAQTLTAMGLPVVLLDRDVCLPPWRSECDLVGSANRHSSHRLTTHLLSLGRRRIAYIAGTLEASSTTARIAGYKEALEEAGLAAPPERVFRVPYDAIETLEAYLKASDADAYVCINDHMAAHVIRDLLALGVRVPDDVSVVGFDDVDYATLVPVPLTTMRQPLEQIARSATQLLLERMKDPKLPARKVSFSCELVVRKSCGACLPALQPKP